MPDATAIERGRVFERAVNVMLGLVPTKGSGLLNSFFPFAPSRFILAFFALACSVFLNDGVRGVERMSTLAMSLGSICGCDCISSQNIYFVRNCLKMRRSYARFVSAQMVSLTTIGNWPICVNVRPYMRKYPFSFNGEPSVTSCAKSRPNPTRAKIRSMLRNWTILIDLAPESFKGVHAG